MTTKKEMTDKEQIEKIIQTYLKNMQLEMQRFANDLIKQIQGEKTK